MIQIISGTNRPQNLSVKIARTYQGLMADGGWEAEILSMESMPENLSAASMYKKPVAGFEQIQETVNRTGVFVFVVPEYNGSFPGILKLFIDACEYPDSFKGKKAVLVGLSAGAGGNHVGLRHLTETLQYLGVEVMPQKVEIPKVRLKLSQEGTLIDKDIIAELSAQISNFPNFIPDRIAAGL